jgi:hypothetical protein
MTGNRRSNEDLNSKGGKFPAPTRQIAETEQAVGMPKNKVAARKGGGIAKKARLELEEKTGRPVVSGSNFLPPKKKSITKGKKK